MEDATCNDQFGCYPLSNIGAGGRGRVHAALAEPVQELLMSVGVGADALLAIQLRQTMPQHVNRTACLPDTVRPMRDSGRLLAFPNLSSLHISLKESCHAPDKFFHFLDFGNSRWSLQPLCDAWAWATPTTDRAGPAIPGNGRHP